MHDNPEKILAQAEALEIRPAGALGVYLFEKQANRTTQLINNTSEEAFVKGQNRKYQFNLSEPVFISQIDVFVVGYSQYKNAKFEFLKLGSSQTEEKTVKLQGERFCLHVNDFVRSFSFKPDKAALGKQKIKSVVAQGLTLPSFKAALTAVSKLDNYKDKVVNDCQEIITKARAAEQNMEGLREQSQSEAERIESLEAEKANVFTELEGLKDIREKVSQEVEKARSEESDAKSRLKSVEDTIDEKDRQSEALNKEIAERNRILTNLKSDINLFPTEISGFVKQGAQNISRYTILSFLPIVIIFYVAWYLFFNASDLAAAYYVGDIESIWGVLLSRLPFVAVSMAVIGACYKIAEIFISEVIRINRQRLSINKIAIIAKDVSESSANGLSFSDDELYEYRTRLKMDLLKSHLKAYLHDDYTYKSVPKKSDNAAPVDDEVEDGAAS